MKVFLCEAKFGTLELLMRLDNTEKYEIREKICEIIGLATRINPDKIMESWAVFRWNSPFNIGGMYYEGEVIR